MEREDGADSSKERSKGRSESGIGPETGLEVDAHGVSSQMHPRNGGPCRTACAAALGWAATLGVATATDILPAPAEPTSIVAPPQSDDTPLPAPAEATPDGLELISAQAEWVYHKTADGAHPSGIEQQFVWLMNRARTLPKGEGRWLATVSEAQSAIRYFNVDTDMLVAEFDAIARSIPAAFDRRLYAAAKAHSDDLVARDAQDHTNQFQRVTDAGFHYTNGRGSVFSYTRNGIYGHAGFNIDWGSGPGGMQTARGHRAGLMATDGNYTNIGVAVVEVTDSGKKVGPYVTTIDYMSARTSYADHYNDFVVGTVWEDLDGDGCYDPGEGLAGVEVRPDTGSHYAVTGEAGGYAFPSGPGSYTITFSGGDLGAVATRTVTKGSASVRLDLVLRNGSPVRAGSPVLAISDDLRTFSWEAEPTGLYELVCAEGSTTWSANGLPGFYGSDAPLSITFGEVPTVAADTFLLRVLDHE